ncbi:MAG: hypothetical protein II038_05685 [Lachnospiraceae bacterium]|nr:hypothetical protein [Lachnospiraceae bacterium]
MMNDYVAGLHDQEEPEQIDCSSGVVLTGFIERETGKSKEEQEILVPVFNHADEIIKMVTSSEEHLKNWNKDPEELAEA